MNFETSSSESEYEHLYYSSFKANSLGAPFYPALGQPLIYYAEIKPKRRKRKSREDEKRKSNCFLKAFRWYTEEHIPVKGNQSSNNTNNSDIKSFATWLDQKYNEYLQTNQIEQTQCILNQSSTLQIINPAKKIASYDDKLRASKKYPRIRSPWYKRRKSLISRDKADFTVKSNQSIKIILKPKDISRPASTCCQGSDLKNKSNSTIKSDTNVLHMKLKPSPKSLTSVLKEKEIYVIPFEFLQDASHEDIKNNIKTNKSNERKILKQIFPKRKSISIAKSYHKRDISCQCSDITSEKNDISSEFDKKQSNICYCYERRQVEDLRKVAVITDMDTEYHTVTINDIEKGQLTLPTLISDSVQTSDYSINLGYHKIPNHPLFMKIICPDKFKENCD